VTRCKRSGSYTAYHIQRSTIHVFLYYLYTAKTIPMSPKLFAGFLAFLLLSAFPLAKAQDSRDLAKILNSTNRLALREMSQRFAKQAEASRTAALTSASQNKWPVRQTFEGGKTIELKGLGPKGKPVYYSTANLNAAKTVGANKTWTGGGLGLNLSGNGVVLREWDAGAVRPTHQELNGRITLVDAGMGLADHSTMVGGTMLASGVVTAAHGMSGGATLRDFDWNYDYAEMAAEAANGALLSNHSYIFITGWLLWGTTWYWYGDPTISQTTDYFYGYYMYDAALVDSIMYSAPYYLVCKAAGNDRLGGPTNQPVPNYVWINNAWVLTNTVRDLNGGPNGWDCISSGFGVSKNTITVGAVYPIPNGYSSPADVVFASFSGTGPTDDGRIKPDLVADGVGLYTTTTASDNAYGYGGGTSLATPNVTGSLALLQEHYHNLHGNYMRSSTLRGLAIHTADEAGPYPGPDYKFGWGLLDVAKAASALSGVCTTIVREDTLVNGETYKLNISAKGSEPLVATLCWTDPAGTPPAPALNPPDLMLVNDLDMRIDSNIFYPYILDPANVEAQAGVGDNFRDNVEKIYIPGISSGNHVLSITHKNSLSGGSQVFSLIVTGLSTNLCAGSVGSSQSVCSGTTPAQLHGIPPSGGNSPYTYQWQSSTDNSVFTDIPGAVNLDFQPGDLSTTTWYRLMQNSAGGCGTVFTNTVCITVLTTPAPVIHSIGDTLYSDAPTGNQWYYEGTLLPGDTSQVYHPSWLNGWFWDVVTLNGCPSDTSNHVYMITWGIPGQQSTDVEIFPVPNDGKFTLSLPSGSTGVTGIRIYNPLGELIWEKEISPVSRLASLDVDLKPASAGLYTIVVRSQQSVLTRRIIVSH